MGKIKLNNIRVHAQHGCLKEESIIGSDYRVDLEVAADLSKPSQSDQLKETVDYVHLNNIVKDNRNTSLSDGEVKFFEDAQPIETAPISSIQSNINPVINSQITNAPPVLAASGTNQNLTRPVQLRDVFDDTTSIV